MRRTSYAPARLALAYGLVASTFLLVGFLLALLFRWQLAFPNRPIPLVGLWLARLLGDELFPGGALAPQTYNQLGGMHGTVMVFLGVVPLGVGAFGHFLVPRLVGARGLAFPRLSWCALGALVLAGTLLLGSFMLPTGAPSSGWTSYAPLAVIARDGQDWWLVGMVLVAASAVVASINLLVTAAHEGAPGMTPWRWPISVWTQSTAAVLLLLAFPPFAAGCVLQLSDRLLGSSFFLPKGLVVSGEAWQAAGGGNPLLWQHLFWFLAHPEVYVLILPALGVVGEVLAANARRPLHGHRSSTWALLALGLLSFLVWAHHMFLTGLGPTMGTFFQLTTVLVSVPSIVLLTNYLLTLRGASLRFPTAMCFALAFLPMFAIGGLTGLPLGLSVSNVPLHDTYYVVGHFHYIVVPGVLFALFAGVYHWGPRLFRAPLHEGWGRVHFWGSLVAMNVLFFPMLLLGLAGVSRRLFDQTVYQHGAFTQSYNVVSTVAAWALAVFQIPFLVNVFVAWRRGRSTPTSPALAGVTTVDAAPENLPVRIVGEPYQYDEHREPIAQYEVGTQEPARPAVHPFTGLSTRALGTALGIAAGLMFFAAIVAAVVALRSGSATWSLAPSKQTTAAAVCGLLGMVLCFLAGRARTAQALGRWIAGFSAAFFAGGFFWCDVVAAHLTAGRLPRTDVGSAAELIAFGTWTLAAAAVASSSLFVLRPTKELAELVDRVRVVRWALGFLGGTLCVLCLALYGVR